MAVQYFESVQFGGLVRVDLDPAHHVAEALNRETGAWVDNPALFEVALFFGERLDYDRLTVPQAEKRARELTGSSDVLAAG